ncbi:unnamed protein product [Candida verbasci]|uniref:EKC/KEOPS complex subunit BUD32 n=1 Tax=Candida verbasci TaxID=1227364 RepID=A0A9W4XMU4_9ASCO|nr:unnamed protein product [Candida verbasci]
MTESLISTLEDKIPNIKLNCISQGAEALVFESDTHPYYNDSKNCIIKYRPSKPYRHPKIDLQITKQRTIGEVKFMYKLCKLGIPCPNIITTDFPNGIIWMEFIGYKLENNEISSFKNWLWYLEKNGNDHDPLKKEVEFVCIKVGELIGKLHLNDMIHGDLTSSNMILVQDDVPHLIDFGLSSFSGLPEDKAVDLYVLERAIMSTHSVYAESYNRWLLKGYQQGYTNKSKYKEVIKRLEDVRLRGRKRSMLG